MTVKTNVFKLIFISLNFVACTKAVPVVELFSKPQGLTLSIENLEVNENSEFVLSGTCIPEISGIEISFDQGSNWSNIQSDANVSETSVLCKDAGSFQLKSLQTLAQLKTLQGSTENAQIYLRGLWVKGSTEEVMAKITAAASSGPPTISISTAQNKVVEGSSAQLTISLSTPATESITVDVATTNLSALSSTHYTAKNETVTFNAGENSKIVNVTTIDTSPTGSDPACEADKEFKLSVSNPTNATLNTTTEQTFIIEDNDVPTLSVSASPTVSESAARVVYSLNLNRLCETKAIAVNVVTSHLTTNSSDLSASPATINITPNTAPSPINIPFTNDSLDEDNETFKIELQTATNSDINPSNKEITFTIVDDDVEPSLSFSTTSSNADEGSTQTLTIQLSAVSGKDVQFKLKAGAGSTASVPDYTSGDIGSVLTIAKGTTSKTVNINLVNDTDFEIAETLFVEIYNNLNASIGTGVHSLTINVSDNFAPIALDKTYYMNSNTASLNILAKRNDANVTLPHIATDVTSTNLQILSIANEVGGTFSGTSTSTLNFDPDNSFFGVASAQVSVTDGFLNSSTVTIQIKVMNNFTWTGAVSNSWSDKNNWCGLVLSDFSGCQTATVPPAISDDVYIDDTCSSSYCEPTLNSDVTISKLSINKNTLRLVDHNLYVNNLYLKGITDTAAKILTDAGDSNSIIVGDNIYIGAFGAKGNAVLKLYGTGVQGIYPDPDTAPVIPNIPSLHIASDSRNIYTSVVQNGPYFKVTPLLNSLSMSASATYTFLANVDMSINMLTFFPFENLKFKSNLATDSMITIYNNNLQVQQNLTCETLSTGKIKLYKSGGVGAGNISVAKDVSFVGTAGCQSPGQSVQVELYGNSLQTLQSNTENMLDVVLDKSAGVVRLASHMKFTNAEIKSLSAATTIDLNEYDLYFDANTIFYSGTKIYRNGGRIYIDGAEETGSVFSGATFYNGAIP